MSKIRHLVSVAVVATGIAAIAAAVASQTAAPTTVVLVHGAFADGSS